MGGETCWLELSAPHLPLAGVTGAAWRYLELRDSRNEHLKTRYFLAKCVSAHLLQLSGFWELFPPLTPDPSLTLKQSCAHVGRAWQFGWRITGPTECTWLLVEAPWNDRKKRLLLNVFLWFLFNLENAGFMLSDRFLLDQSLGFTCSRAAAR